MFQQLIVVGNLGRDPEMRYTTSGVPVTTFSLAANERGTNREGQPWERTTWFRITAWRKLAETCNQYLSKGRQVMVVGRVSVSAYSRQDGEPGASLEVTADTVRFLGSRDFEGSSDNGAVVEEEAPF